MKNDKTDVVISADDYDAERDQELANADIGTMNTKTIHTASVDDKHITIKTTDGWAYRFYGFLEAVPPGGHSMYDEPEPPADQDL